MNKLKSIFAIATAIICGQVVYAQSWSEEMISIAADQQANDNYGKSVDIDGNYAVIGAVLQNTDASSSSSMQDAGAVYVLHYNGANWTPIQKIVPNDRATYDEFGTSVAIEGNVIVVGATGNDFDESGSGAMQNAGAAYIFTRSNNTWLQQQKIVASDRSGSDVFGNSVDISGDYIAVGAKREDENASGSDPLSNSGSVYIFKQGQNGWVQEQKIVASDRGNDDEFGFDVSIEGEKLVVGVPFDNPTNAPNTNLSGSAYIFKHNGTSWTEQQKIVAPNIGEGQIFGLSVDISGDQIIIGAPGDDTDASGGNPINSAGAAYLFNKSNNVWSMSQKIVAIHRAPYTAFGFSVSIDGNNVAVGARTEKMDETGLSNSIVDAGAAYVFRNSNNTWSQSQKIVPSDRAAYNYFGTSISIDNNLLISGAPGKTTNAGGSYIFRDLCQTFSTETTTTCDQSYVWSTNGVNYTQSGTYEEVFINAAGCDSVVTLDLTLLSTNTNVSENNGTLTAEVQGADYQWIDCANNNAFIAGETNQSFTPTSNGEYAVIVIENGCEDTSSCFTINNVGLTSINDFGNSVKLYPNPTQDNVTLEIGQSQERLKISIVSAIGTKLKQIDASNKKSLTLNLETLDTGVYFIRIETPAKTIIKQIIKK